MIARRSLLVLALVAGLTAGALYFIGAQRTAMVVASRDVAVIRPLTAADLDLRWVPPDTLPPGALSSVDDAIGRVPTSPLWQGQPLVARALADDAATFHTGLTLRPGERAIAIPVVAVSAVGGSIAPGARIDVLAVPVLGRAPAGRSVELLAADALVLDVRTESGAPYVPRPHDSAFAVDRIGSVIIAIACGRDPVRRSHRHEQLRARVQLGPLSVKTNLRLDAVTRSAFDVRLAQLGGGRLTRTAGVTYLESDRDAEDATHRLAFAGIRCSWSSVPSPATGLRPAIAHHLEPLDAALGAIDVVELTPIPMSEASAALMHRRLPWLGRSRSALDACLRLLREEDAVIGWRRTVWCSVSAMRVARARMRLHPVVFDRAAVDRQTLRWTYASAGAIERWAFT